MVKVYGYSDDLVIIEGPIPEEIDCFRKKVIITFDDGTVIDVHYPKRHLSVWEIDVLTKGTTPFALTSCRSEDARIYSDIFEINSEISSITLLDKED